MNTVDPAGGPYLFDTSAESWLARSRDSAVGKWFRAYLARGQVHISSANSAASGL